MITHTPTPADEERAFQLLRRPDWPATLAELRAAERQAGLVHGLAQRLANGCRYVPPADLDNAAGQDAPPPRLRAWDFPARLTGSNPHTPHRRRTDAIDGKSLAAGERADD
jgi:hypothetical protein